MPDKFSGDPVNLYAAKIVEHRALKVVDRGAPDDCNMSSLTVKNITIYRSAFCRFDNTSEAGAVPIPALIVPKL